MFTVIHQVTLSRAFLNRMDSNMDSITNTAAVFVGYGCTVGSEEKALKIIYKTL